jgi:hypothetical protein
VARVCLLFILIVEASKSMQEGRKESGVEHAELCEGGSKACKKGSKKGDFKKSPPQALT